LGEVGQAVEGDFERITEDSEEELSELEVGPGRLLEEVDTEELDELDEQARSLISCASMPWVQT
jgi:hypothetical protein